LLLRPLLLLHRCFNPSSRLGQVLQSFARPSVDSSFVRPLLVITLLLCVDLLCWLFDLSLWIACELLQGEIGVILELSDKNLEFFRS
jgi:hypothetical protein